MAFFKFRKGGDEQASAAPPESIEAMRKRARYRLLGAVVLVIAGVIGFPLLFDKQPRPIAVDMTIDIPDKNKVKPMAIPAPPPATPVASTKPSSPATAAPAERKQAMASGKVEDKPQAAAPAPVAPAAPKPAAVPEKTDDKAAAKAEEAARAQALLEGKPQTKVAVNAPVKATDDKKAASNERYVVQVGAFADAAHAREVRLKVERAGMKTYTQVVNTSEGKRIRVRVGPFTSKAEVNKVAEKIKKLDLPAAVLTL